MIHPDLTPVQPGPTPEQPKLAGKYETPDELAKGYMNLQTTLTERNRELQEMRQRLDAIEQQRIMPQERVDYRAELEGVGVPPAAVEALAQEAVQRLVGPMLAAEEAKARATRRHEVLAKNEQEVVQYLQENPEKMRQFQQAWNAGLYDMAYDWAANEYLQSNTMAHMPQPQSLPPAALMPPGLGGNRMAAMAETVQNNEQALWDRFAQTRSATELIKSRLLAAQGQNAPSRGIYG